MSDQRQTTTSIVYGALDPDQIYERGDGMFSHRVRLSRLWEPEPKVIYEGLAQVHVHNIDRTKQKTQRGGYPIHDYTLAILNPDWAECGRSDYEDAEYGKSYVVEDYQLELLPLEGDTPSTKVPFVEPVGTETASPNDKPSGQPSMASTKHDYAPSSESTSRPAPCAS